MILFVASDFIPHIGGKSTHILDLQAGLKCIGEDSFLFSQRQYPKNKRLLIKVMLAPIRLVSTKLFIYIYNKIWSRVFSRAVFKLYKGKKPDCISCQDAFAASSLKRIRNRIECPIVLTMHTYFGLENSLDCKLSKLQKRIYKKNLAYELKSLEVADKIIAVDNRILEHVKKTITDEKNSRSIRVNKCVAVENFTNTDIFSPVSQQEKLMLRERYGIDKKRFVIICARRLVEKNGVLYAVKATKNIDNDCVLIIAGDGPQYAQICSEIEKEELKDKIILLGSVESDKIVELYRLADCSLVPSVTVNGLQEATSISALEAMSCGLPTIASGIGGLLQLITDGVNGYLVNEKNPKQIADCIGLLRDEKNREYMSENARQYVVENHSNIQAARTYYQLFRS